MASTPLIAVWQLQVRHYRPLIERIITQSERRVLVGELVPASDKLVSLFEPHADIIVKGSCRQALELRPTGQSRPRGARVIATTTPFCSIANSSILSMRLRGTQVKDK